MSCLNSGHSSVSRMGGSTADVVSSLASTCMLAGIVLLHCISQLLVVPHHGNTDVDSWRGRSISLTWATALYQEAEIWQTG